MSLVEVLMKQAPVIAGELAKNPQILKAALSLLSAKDPSVGGATGLGGLVEAFQQKGLGDMVGAWISRGPNPPVSTSQLEDVLGSDVLGQFAKKAGLPSANAGSVLASMLPSLIDHLTPDGAVPHANSLEDTIGSLLGGLAR